MDDSAFDVIIIGTGLTESITAAALCKAGHKVAHVDENAFYGGDEATLSLDELVEWADRNTADTQSRYTHFKRSPDLLPFSRQYSICLCPSLIPSIGPTITSLVASGVSKYGGFRLLERVGIYDQAAVRSVPGSKEDIFKSKEISLVDKRRLMRFLMFAGGDFEGRDELHERHSMPFNQFLATVFELSEALSSSISFSLAYCSSPTDPTLPALRRIRRYLRSAGRYGSSPFLVGHYGGTGDIAQGFCRAAAVSGGVYILGRRIKAINFLESFTTSRGPTDIPKQDTKTVERFTLELDDFSDTLSCKVLISSSTRTLQQVQSQLKTLPASALYDNTHMATPVARCIAIIDKPLTFDSTTPPAPDTNSGDASPLFLDTAVLVFPPATVPGGSTESAATLLVMGEHTLSTPRGKWIVYITLPLLSPISSEVTSAESILHPYLDAALTFCHDPQAPFEEASTKPSNQPLFTLFYVQHPIQPTGEPGVDGDRATATNLCVVPPSVPLYPYSEGPDAAATNAESLFKETISLLRKVSEAETSGSPSNLGISEEENEPTPFWPPLQDNENDEQEDEGW